MSYKLQTNARSSIVYKSIFTHKIGNKNKQKKERHNQQAAKTRVDDPLVLHYHNNLWSHLCGVFFMFKDLVEFHQLRHRFLSTQ